MVVETNGLNFVSKMNTVNCLLISPPDNLPHDSGSKSVILPEDAGAYLRFCLPKREQKPMDHESGYEDPMYSFSHSIPLSEVNAAEFDLLFIVGKYGAKWRSPESKNLKRLLVYFIRENKTVVWLTMLKP
jgi:hypothetical protein